MRINEKVKVNADNTETHPAFGIISASRITSSGASLFQSEVLSNGYIAIRICTATRKRYLHTDRVWAGPEIIEVNLTYAQWAEFISTMNIGEGVPCTIASQNGRMMPGISFMARTAAMLDEVRDSAARLVKPVKEALQVLVDSFEGKMPRKHLGPLNGVLNAVGNLPHNAHFTGEMLNEVAETVTSQVKIEVAAYAGLNHNNVNGIFAMPRTPQIMEIEAE
jgi:hypothetical protein